MKREDMAPWAAAIGRSLRNRREMRGLSMKEVADACDVDKTNIGSAERGERLINLATLESFAAAVGCRASDVVYAAERILEDARAAERELCAESSAQDH